MAKKRKNEGNEIKAKQWKEFFDEFQSESERGAVLVGTAFLDEHLGQLLANFMIADDANQVNELLTGPLDRPFAKARTAYCLGLIGKDAFDDLKLIINIRNRFAHELQGLSFEDEQIMKWCGSLQLPAKSMPLDWPLTAKSRFLIAVAILASWISLHALNTKRVRRERHPNLEVVRNSAGL